MQSKQNRPPPPFWTPKLQAEADSHLLKQQQQQQQPASASVEPPAASLNTKPKQSVLRVVVRGFSRIHREVVAIVLEQCARDSHAALQWAALEVWHVCDNG